MTGRTVHLLVPAGVDDPQRVSGGNVYDRRVRDGLGRHGWEVAMAEAADGAGVASALHGMPDDAVVLVDGLVAACAVPEVATAAGRMRLVVLAHMVAAAFPDASAGELADERRVLAAAHRVVVTSRWTAGELVRRGLAERDRITVAVPGVQPAAPAQPDGDGDLLCVGVVAPHKGQDTLLAALARLPETDWTCTMAGSALSHAGFAAGIARAAAGLGDRVTLPGVQGDTALGRAYHRSALMVAPSRVESAGMAIGEARARGIPVVGAAVGGIPDTLAGGGGILVPPGDPEALAGVLHMWMTDPSLRERLRREALAVRAKLPGWDATMTAIAAALQEA